MIYLLSPLNIIQRERPKICRSGFSLGGSVGCDVGNKNPLDQRHADDELDDEDEDASID